jgi:hypothetical protein
LIRQLDNASLSHAVFANKSEPKISYDARSRRYAVSSERNWFEEIEAQGPLKLAFTVKSGKRESRRTISTSDEISAEQYQQYLTTNPVHLMSTREFQYLWVDNGFYEADSDLTFEQAVALVRSSSIKRARKIQRAVEMSQVHSGLGNVRQDRQSIPDEVKHLVWNRDGGCCANCGASSDLQYDHVIPLALGGSNSLNNLQLLCGPCNRRKGPTLTVNHLPNELLGRKNHVPNAEFRPTETIETEAGFLPGPFYSLSPRSQERPKMVTTGTRSYQFANAKVQELTANHRRELERYSNLRRPLDKDARDLIQFLNSFEGANCTVAGEYPEDLTIALKLTIDDQRVRNGVEELLLAWSSCYKETNRLWVGISSRFAPLASRINVMNGRIQQISKISNAGAKVSEWVRVLNELVDIEESFDRLLSDKELEKSTQRLQGLDGRIRRYCKKKLGKAKIAVVDPSGKERTPIESFADIKEEDSQSIGSDAIEYENRSITNCEICSSKLRFDSGNPSFRCPQCSSIYAKCSRCHTFSTAGNSDPTWKIFCEKCD